MIHQAHTLNDSAAANKVDPQSTSAAPVAVDRLLEKVRDAILTSVGPVDMLDVVDRELVDLREHLIDLLEREAKHVDSRYYEDPNPIVRHPYPVVNTDAGRSAGVITFEDLWKRSPYSLEDRALLQNSTVGYVGFGGIQESALLLARSGVGNFILADHDCFESTNANRQALCQSTSLGRPKVEVGAEALKAINDDIKVTAHQTKCDASKMETLFKDADVIVDGSGDHHFRTALHSYARESKKPIICWAWAGWEGQSITFLPNHPLYYEAFNYSPYSNERGFDAAGLSVLNGFVAKDAVNLLLGKEDKVVSFPLLATYSLFRQGVVQIRDVTRIRDRHARNE